MKIIYSHLKKFLPQLSDDSKKVRDDLTMIGHFVSGYEEIDSEIIFDVEVRQNRADTLGYYGLAKDLSVFYQIPLVTSSTNLPQPSTDYRLPIKVIAKNDVKRVMAIRISGIKVTKSPSWLTQFLKLHQINSINNVVDLTNYIMLLYSVPCHAFDVQKTTNNLIWELNNNKYKKFTTLDGTDLELNTKNLLISNPKTVLSLGFIGGQNSGIEFNTTETIIEMAVYNPYRIRQDSRQLKTITEASIRLDKFLDTQLIPQAFNHLIKLLLENTGGEISSQIYDNYIDIPKSPKVEFDPDKPSQYAGIKIPKDFTLTCLQSLDCIIEAKNDKFLITPPTLRKDLNLEEDFIEEVIRFYGYNKIPLNQPINPKPLSDITPPVLYLIESLKNILSNLGYDETRSWPLISENNPFRPDIKTEIKTQNSINSDYPILRQSIIASLWKQEDIYNRLKLPNLQFFEIGKIYFKNLKTKTFEEKYSLGLYNDNSQQLNKDIKNISQKLQIDPAEFQSQTVKNKLFYELTLDPLIDNKVKLSYLKENNIFRNLAPKNNHAYELTSQIITLDANVILNKKSDPHKLINKYSTKIGNENLWQITISDIFKDQKINKYRYTFKVSYFNLDDKTAKKIHKKAFDLK